MPDHDCMTCSPAERYQRPNRGHITITDEDTGVVVRVCGGCRDTRMTLLDIFLNAAPTEPAPRLGDPLPAPARA